MEKKDFMELKKRFKKEETTITTIYSSYRNSEGEEICSRKENLLVMKDKKENDFHKFLDMQKKLLSCKHIDLNFINEETNDIKKILETINKNALKDENLIEILIDELSNAYLKEIKGNFLITLAADTYDVPTKTTDGFKVDESEEVYTYIMCSICPVVTSKAGLGYIENENTIGSRYQDWIVNPPELGFIYPSFTNRSSDNSTITYLFKNEKKKCETIIEEVLCTKIEKINSTEEIKTKIIDNEIDTENLEQNLNINKNLEEESIEENEEIIKENIDETINNKNDNSKEDKKNYENLEEYNNEEDYKMEIIESELNEEKKEESGELDVFFKKINEILEENKNKAEVQIINGKKFLMIPID